MLRDFTKHPLFINIMGNISGKDKESRENTHVKSDSGVSQASHIDLDNPEFNDAKQLIDNTNASVFLTGRAGTGKSTFMRHIIATTAKKCVVLAPTGIAAINAGGQTIHSFFRLPMKPILPEDPEFSVKQLRKRLRYGKEHIKLIKELELLVIDEISMVRADTIDIIDRILRIYSGNLRTPFGGKQLLMVGDLYQLGPVAAGDSRDILRNKYSSLYFFCSDVFRKFSPVPVELRKIYRQGEDAVFASLLDHVRMGTASMADIAILNRRVATDNTENSMSENMTMILTSRRNMASQINEEKLALLQSTEISYQAEVEGDFKDGEMPAEKILTLKEGAQVVFIKNDSNRRWVNGTIGVVESCDETSVAVRTEDNVLHAVERETWTNVKYVYDETKKSVDEIVLGTFVQFPLRLAWAITIHKSQGLTFNNVIVDIGSGAFASGQTYVALSRCRCLKGLILRNPITLSDITVNPVIRSYSTTFNNREAINKTLRRARAMRLYTKAANEATLGNFPEAVEDFFAASELAPLDNTPIVMRLARRKTLAINQLQTTIVDLKEQLRHAQEKIAAVADEYLAMAEMLMQETCDVDAAMANINKAIELCPTSVRGHLLRAKVFCNQGEINDAFEAASSAWQMSDEPSVELYHIMGDIALTDRDHLSAMEYYKEAEALDDTSLTTLQRIADLYANLGDTKKAEQYQQKIRRLKK